MEGRDEKGERQKNLEERKRTRREMKRQAGSDEGKKEG